MTDTLKNLVTKKTATWKLLLVFIFFAGVVTVLDGLIFGRYKESVRISQQEELGAIAELKIRQITNWMAERKGDAQNISGDILFLDRVERWMSSGSRADKAMLLRHLLFLQKNSADYGYTQISLLDDKAMPLLSTAAEDVLPQQEKDWLLESMRSGQVLFSDIHQESSRGGPILELDMTAPLILHKRGRSRTLGILHFHLDPRRFLFPLLQRWPTSSISAESLLVRRDGDDAVFMDGLLRRKGAAFAMRVPLSQRQLLAAMAVLGREGMVEGIDYSGAPVVGVLRKVPGTTWFMVSKIDKAEIYAPISRLANWVIALGLFLVSTGGGVLVYWREKEKLRYAATLKNMVLGKHLDYLSKYANDIILLADAQGTIIDFNDRALEAYGYPAEEFVRLNVGDLCATGFSPPLSARFEELGQTGSLRFEALHVRKSGLEFPVESSVRLVDIGGGKFYQAIIRDITLRRNAEMELKNQKDILRQVIDSVPSFIFINDAEGRFQLANKAFAENYGQTTVSIIGKSNRELLVDEERLVSCAQAMQDVLVTQQELESLESAVFADGKLHWLKTTRKPWHQGEASSGLLTIAMDITELKDAAARLQRLNRTLRLLSSCNVALIHAEEETALLCEICKLIVEIGGYSMVWVGYAEHDAGRTVRPIAWHGFEDGYLDSAAISWADEERGRGPTGSAIRTGKTQIIQDFMSDPGMTPWREAAAERGYQSSIALPLMHGDQAFGALTIYSPVVKAFNSEEVTLLEELADELSFGVATLRMRAEHKVAEENLKFKNALLLTQQEVSMDGILAVDKTGKIISLNRRFISMWSIPDEIVESRSDERALQAVVDNLAEPERFFEKVRYLYEHEQEISLDEILLRDGRVIERHTAPMNDSDGQCYGRVWYFRDITESKNSEKALRELNADMSATLRAIPDLLFVLDKDGRYLNIWARDPELLAAQEESLLGCRVDEVFARDAAEAVMSAIREAGEHGYSSGQVIRIDLPQGEKWFELSTSSIKPGRDPSDSRFIMLSRDITKRMQAERMLIKHQAFMRQIIDADPSRIFVKDADGKFLLVNRITAAAHGMTPQEMVGKNLSAINFIRSDIENFMEADRKVPADGNEIRSIELQTLPDGRQCWLLTVEKPLNMPDGTQGMLGIAMDITEQKQAEIKLAQSYKKLQRLSLHLESVRMEERAKIALDLHDEMGAMLAAIKMSLAWLATRLPAGMPKLAEEVSRLTELTSAAIQTMHHVVSQLRPNLLDDLGFAAAVEDYVKKFQQHMEVECKLTMPEEDVGLDKNQSVTVFRILQESLNNVARHAHASQVSILFTQQDGSLSMLVEDNGSGFDADMQKEQSFGLLGIKERALMIGGKASVDSTPGMGTRLSVSIPISFRPHLNLNDPQPKSPTNTMPSERAAP
ncbi:MAG: PAS domain S-box protein [Nitrosomonadales bacterium]|nr:PAS domain S-box protein [Nitrosomonadales bacterium]